MHHFSPEPPMAKTRDKARTTTTAATAPHKTKPRRSDAARRHPPNPSAVRAETTSRRAADVRVSTSALAALTFPEPKIRQARAAGDAVPTSPDDPLSAVVAEINTARMGAMRTGKALVEFGRAAGRGLSQARALVHEGEFDAWVLQTLGMTLREAEGFIGFAENAEVSRADVSSATAMTVVRVMELVSVLWGHLRDTAVVMPEGGQSSKQTAPAPPSVPPPSDRPRPTGSQAPTRPAKRRPRRDWS